MTPLDLVGLVVVLVGLVWCAVTLRRRYREREARERHDAEEAQMRRELALAALLQSSQRMAVKPWPQHRKGFKR